MSLSCSGWPFAALAGLPLALEAIGSIGFAGFAAVVANWGVVISLPSVSVDSYLYGRPVLAALNVFWYNLSVSREGGSQLYGVEPASYYSPESAAQFQSATAYRRRRASRCALESRQPASSPVVPSPPLRRSSC